MTSMHEEYHNKDFSLILMTSLFYHYLGIMSAFLNKNLCLLVFIKFFHEFFCHLHRLTPDEILYNWICRIMQYPPLCFFILYLSKLCQHIKCPRYRLIGNDQICNTKEYNKVDVSRVHRLRVFKYSSTFSRTCMSSL